MINCVDKNTVYEYSNSCKKYFEFKNIYYFIKKETIKC